MDGSGGYEDVDTVGDDQHGGSAGSARSAVFIGKIAVAQALDIGFYVDGRVAARIQTATQGDVNLGADAGLESLVGRRSVNNGEQPLSPIVRIEQTLENGVAIARSPRRGGVRRV